MSNQPSNLSNLYALFQQRMDALYQSDNEKRMVCTNEWEPSPPPRFHLMRTAKGVICRCQADLPDEIVHRLEELCRQENAEGWAERLPSHYERYLEIISDHGPVKNVWSGPAYIALEEIAPKGETTVIDAGNASLLRERMADWLPDVPYRRPFAAVVKDDGAVSVCASVRISKSVHCAGVETHPQYRHCGYAVDVVAAWASAVRAEGAFPFYSTSWENAASQGVAKRLNMTLAAVDFNVR